MDIIICILHTKMESDIEDLNLAEKILSIKKKKKKKEKYYLV